MKIVIAGGSGFLGNAIKNYFTDSEIYILTRKPKEKGDIFWDAKTLGDWVTILEGSDVLINLTGKSVDCRYNDKNRAEILNSRIQSTRILQEAVDKSKYPPKCWLNSSSATIYIHAETQLMTETNGIIGDDFSMNICKSWEKVFFEKDSKTTRKIALRTAIVLGKEGEAFKKLKLITRLGLGGPQGSGRQMFSWIHVYDFCKAVEFLINNNEIKGVINISTPNTISNKSFMQTLRTTLNMPFGLPAPNLLLEIGALILGTETELLKKSRNVYPEKLLQNGFKFSYETIDSAISEIVK